MSAKVLVTGAGRCIGHRLVPRLMERGYWVPGVDLKHPEYEPVNLGSERLLSIDELVEVARIAGKRVTKCYDPAKPQGRAGATATTRNCGAPWGGSLVCP